MTTPLADRIATMIRTAGPISVADYFALCLADPEHGYYKTRQPFGRTGDFVTAPEISQLFGEMLGVFIVHAWQQHGLPASVKLVEIGPGRGTMMADMLRVIARIAAPLYENMTVHMVETSKRLRETQRETLVQHAGRISWHDSFTEVPDGFTLVVANELFDAIPLRQFVRTNNGFRERMVGLDAEGNLAFMPGVAGIDPAILPDDAGRQPEGTIFEYSPAREAVMATIAARLRSFGGSALIIDYGHMISGFGDTLQALRRHRFDPPLAHPGEADLTSHVDFEHLAGAAKASGAHINGCIAQGDFLRGLGINERAAALGGNADDDTRRQITDAVLRLAGDGEGRMGELFKVLAISSPALPLLPFRPID